MAVTLKKLRDRASVISTLTKVEALDPDTQEPTGWVISVMNTHLPRCAIALSEQSLKYDELLAGAKSEAKKKKLNEQMTIAQLAAVIDSWEGLVDDDGNPVQYSHELAVELLSADTFLALQIANTVRDQQVFFQKPEQA